MTTFLWIQGWCCGADAISFLNAEQPDVLTTLEMLECKCFWHPNFSYPPGLEMKELIEKILKGDVKLDVLVVEGAIPLHPRDTTQKLDTGELGLRECVIELCNMSDYTLALGTCASFGGLVTSGKNSLGLSGLQFSRRQAGGILGKDYCSKANFPVINIPGCPAHPDWLTETLIAIARRHITLEDLDVYNRPRAFYSKLAHHACPKNEFYEFKASAVEYSQQGCLFENLGCKGTICESDCNERLWLSRTGSCPRGGFPCLSCTSPDFPDAFTPFFETPKIGNIPTTLPRDVPKAWYVGISGLAKLACPERLKKNAVSQKYH